MIEELVSLVQTVHSLLDARNPVALAAMGVIGLIIGSFLSVVIVRLPVMIYQQAPEQWTAPPEKFKVGGGESIGLSKPPSRCGHCRHQLRWYENLPVFSFIFLRGKCAACHQSISPLYPVVELLACMAAILAALRFGGDVRLLGALVLSCVLITVSVIDIRHCIIPDDIVLPVTWLGLLCNAFGLFISLEDALFGAVVGYVTLWSVYQLHRMVTGREGMGYGDFKLSAMMGAWLGIELMPLILVLSFAGGAIFGTVLMISGRAKMASAISFGPWLAAGGAVCLYWGNALIQVYRLIAVPG